MQIPVLIEMIAGNGFRARGGEPLPLVVEAPTREEALAKLRAACQARLQNGTEIISLDLTPANHPWLEFAGMFKNDPLVEEWKQAMAEYRLKVEEDPDYP